MHTLKTNPVKRYSSQLIIIVIVCGAFAAGVFVAMRLGGPPGGMTGPPPGMTGPAGPPAVYVQTVQERAIDKETEFIAHVEPIHTVDLRPRISGYIATVHFTEGSLVEQGQLLFTIDPREYEATVDLRAAELAQAEARLVRAQKYLARLQAAETRSIPQTDIDTAESEVNAARATVDMARASLELARIDLGYTRITAPVSGRIGPAEIKAGNYVSSATARLARIVQVDPVRVRFSPADRLYLAMRQKSTAGDAPAISARVLLPGDIELSTIGRRDFVDNEMDPDTGTITVWLRFDNPDGLLIPGTYVKLLLSRKERPTACTVPQAAIVTDAHGTHLFVVDDARTVARRTVTLGAVLDGSVVVESGIVAGDRVITEGLQKVRPGVVVNPIEIAATTRNLQ